MNISFGDCETAGTLQNPLPYDFGNMIINLKGENIGPSINYINKNVFYDKQDMMQSCYYANKLPAYRDEIWEGEREVFEIEEIRERVHQLFKEYNIHVFCAHNASFDVRALNNAIKDATNGRINYFFPYGTEIWDTLKMARQVLGKMPTYRKFCEQNGYMTNHAKPRPRMTAEIIYRFISKDNNFEEAHTGLRDVNIEVEIFKYIMKQHRKVNKVLYPKKAD